MPRRLSPGSRRAPWRRRTCTSPNHRAQYAPHQRTGQSIVWIKHRPHEFHISRTRWKIWVSLGTVRSAALIGTSAQYLSGASWSTSPPVSAGSMMPQTLSESLAGNACRQASDVGIDERSPGGDSLKVRQQQQQQRSLMQPAADARITTPGDDRFAIRALMLRYVESQHSVSGADATAVQCRSGGPARWQPVRRSPAAHQPPRGSSASLVSPVRLEEALADVRATSVWQRRSSRQLIRGILKQVMLGAGAFFTPSTVWLWPFVTRSSL